MRNDVCIRLPTYGKGKIQATKELLEQKFRKQTILDLKKNPPEDLIALKDQMDDYF